MLAVFTQMGGMRTVPALRSAVAADCRVTLVPLEVKPATQPNAPLLLYWIEFAVDAQGEPLPPSAW